MIQRRIFITGKVQGVGFRAGLLAEASQHRGIHGFVRNLSDARVEAVFAGDEVPVLTLLNWCTHGPRSAEVKEVRIIEERIDESLLKQGFSIQREGSEKPL